MRLIFTHFREHGIGKTLTWFHSKEAPASVQFAKYGIAGGLATVAHQGTWLLVCFTLFPAFSAEEIQSYREILAKIHLTLPHLEVEGMALADNIRALHSTYGNIIGWFFGNGVAYAVNAAWVFQGGRHNRWLEFLYFTAISGFATLAGLMAGPYLIKTFGISTGLSQLSLLFTSILVNYVCRKFFVFSK
ncbi:MAG: GtrA family protein [Verrucomicrobiae bacterium]|nr:GtrA family protein [Verrucomicrobiae bacterium]